MKKLIKLETFDEVIKATQQIRAQDDDFPHINEFVVSPDGYLELTDKDGDKYIIPKIDFQAFLLAILERENIHITFREGTFSR